MADVYRARLTGIGGFEREVAVKLLRSPFAADAEFVDMLLDEARIAGSIVHSNVVQVLDVGREGDDSFFLVMELVDGIDLRRLLKRAPAGRLPLEHALYIAMETARGLAAVHSSPRRVVHRDVSPTNVLLSRAGEVKLSDFGIARAQTRLARTRAGNIKGKLRYMAPEQLAGRPVDARADLYALGILLAETLTGPVLWEGVDEAPSVGTLLARVARAGLPPDVTDVLQRALRAQPDQRFADAASMRRALAEPLHARQPGYGESNLAAYLADPTAPVQVEGAPDPLADATIQSSLPLASTMQALRDPWQPTPQIPNQPAAPGMPATHPGRDEPPTRNLRVSIARRALAGLRALTSRQRLLIVLAAALAVTSLLGLIQSHTTNPAAAAPRTLPADAPVVAARILAARPALPAPPARVSPPGRLAVYAPANVRVRVGATERHAPALFTLRPGRHRVEVITPRGRRIVRQVDITSDRTAELSVR